MSGRECEKEWVFSLLGREIRIHLLDTGSGLDILIEGGDQGHIGAVAIAGPGQELQVVTFSGHREDVVCKSWAEELRKVYPGPVVVAAGIHYDRIGKEELREVVEALDRERDAVADELLAGMKPLNRAGTNRWQAKSHTLPEGRASEQERTKMTTEAVSITNKTMELADCRDRWTFNRDQDCWCLEDLVYTEKAGMPEFQRLSIFVPGPYMKENGQINWEGSRNGYTPKTAPVVFGNNSAGYSEMPHLKLDSFRCNAGQYLKRGFLYITCGNRGSQSRDQEGRWCGKSPANLVDLKTAIRFLRHNRAEIPGDLERIISVGTSAGGAMSALLGVTGNHEDFLPYLEENGAFLSERDDVYAVQAYCPITDLDHADLAYEWMFGADKENENSHAGPAGVMTPFQEALSAELSRKYIAYFNSLGLKEPDTGRILQIGEDGRSGSGYDYLMGQLGRSAGKFLRKLEAGELPEGYSVEDYLAGNYEEQVQRGFSEDGKPLMAAVKGDEKSGWLSWDGKEARISDLDTYVLNHRRRMKPCTSFDTLGMNSGENRVFGSGSQPFMHFNRYIPGVLEGLKGDFPKEYGAYYDAWRECMDDEGLSERMYLYNPLHYIGTETESRKHPEPAHFRIRVGGRDADTSTTVSMTLALKLSEAGKDVDYAIVWDQPHCEADYPGELCDWIEAITKL